ncbi:hypothetical protein TanjilG_20298 [Lupinus angustifolius]|uniref:Uncharacterized protein n=1 Tax=Lupinus angustifolius TaxID=3871 RepID=A0A1J7FNF0_LUPAN|nr:hypothetical protein TanjilG_20298 [Lupinus angustifolius]
MKYHEKLDKTNKHTNMENTVKGAQCTLWPRKELFSMQKFQSHYARHCKSTNCSTIMRKHQNIRTRLIFCAICSCKTRNVIRNLAFASQIVP